MRRADRILPLLLAALATGGACARPAPVVERMEIGRHRVRLVTPRGWEHLDHGRAQLFRNGEWELRLEDLGPATTTHEDLAGELLMRSGDTDRREIARRDSVTVHGVAWVRLETWSRVSHLEVRRTAFTVADSSLLALTSERGPDEQTGGAFDSLLASLEIEPRP